MSLQQWLTAQDLPEVPVNENFKALEHMVVYAKDATTTTGLTLGLSGWALGWLCGRCGHADPGCQQHALHHGQPCNGRYQREQQRCLVDQPGRPCSCVQAHGRPSHGDGCRGSTCGLCGGAWGQ